ncbi:MAG: transporter substrate-binding domain-containing protein [Pseudomonadota bacterium]
MKDSFRYGAIAVLSIMTVVLLSVRGSHAADMALVTGDGYPPYAGKALPRQGLASEIVRRVFAEMGHTVSLEFLPWKRGFLATQKGTFVATFPYGRNAAREEKFFYSEPLYEVRQHFFARIKSDLTFQRDEDLDGLRVCVPIGYNPVRLNKLVEKGLITLDRPADLKNCFQMLARARTDLVRVSEPIGWIIIEELFGSRENFQMLPRPVRETVEYLIVSKTLPNGDQLVADFNAALQVIKDSGELEVIQARHLE